MQVDFYVLPEAGDTAREHFCCRLAEKAWREGVRVFVRTGDAATAERLDQRLWTFRPGSFVPHALAAEADGEPVLVGAEPPASGELLINLGADVAGDWQAWSRVAEIVSRDADNRRRGRERFRVYREGGTEPQTHNLQGGTP